MIDIEKVKELALDGDLYAVQELINRLEAAEKDAARWKAIVAEAERDYVEVSFSEEPYYQRFECAAAMEEFADAAMKEMK